MGKEKRTYADRRAYLVQAVTKRRRKLKTMAVEYKGGECQACGYKRCIGALEFHHLDPAQKEIGIGYKGHTRSWELLRSELDKCVLLCANCHREIESGMTNPINT